MTGWLNESGAPEELSSDTAHNGTGAADFGHDPLSPSCPDDLPCRTQDSELWFADSPGQLEMAKQFCRDCPARLACLAGAIARREPWGVWGGEIFDGGVIVARKRPRGRPRRTDHGSLRTLALCTCALCDHVDVVAHQRPRPRPGNTCRIR